ncbi:hypothetical protein EWB00_002030, partial [Schistosoma japonicum]
DKSSTTERRELHKPKLENQSHYKKTRKNDGKKRQLKGLKKLRAGVDGLMGGGEGSVERQR